MIESRTWTRGSVCKTL